MLWTSTHSERERRHELIGFTTFAINGRLIERRHANNAIRKGNESKQRSYEHSDSVTRSHWLRQHGSASHILPHLINVILRIYKRLAFLYKIRDFLANFLATTSLNLLVNGQIDLSVSCGGARSSNQLVTGHFPRVWALMEHIARIIALLSNPKQWVAVEGIVVAGDSITFRNVPVRPRRVTAVINASRPSAIFIITFNCALLSAIREKILLSGPAMGPIAFLAIR